MSSIGHGWWLLAMALAIPLVPWVIWGDRLDAAVEHHLVEAKDAWTLAVATIVVLVVDVALPVPSSLVGTLAGARLGFLVGTTINWLGLSLGAVLAFAVARVGGTPLVQRFVAPDDRRTIERLVERWGVRVLIVTRALPLLAEASVLFTGATGLTWRRFITPTLLANLGLAAAYAGLGAAARQGDQLPIALAASIIVPVLATALARRYWPRLRDDAERP